MIIVDYNIIMVHTNQKGVAEMENKIVETKMTREEAERKAHEVVNNWQGEWPEDDWIAISQDWDLNLYEDEDDGRGATLYPVVDMNTVTISLDPAYKASIIL